LKPFGVASLAKELGLAIAPSLSSAIVVLIGYATTRAFENRRRWLTLWYELSNYR